jgi:two-component system LytT family response regulator
MIVDDEAPARQGLRIRLRREAGVVIVGEYGDATGALAALRSDRPDVLFLDIEMPGLDGFALLERAGAGAAPMVVFVTAHAEHAVRGFDIDALDYLLKPVEQDRLHATVARAREQLVRIAKGEIVDRMRGLMRESESGGGPVDAPAARQSGAARIPVRQGDRITFVSAEDIDWIEAAGDLVRVHAGKARHEVRKSMGEVLAMLSPAQFLRIHRSTIVNAERVRELQPWFHGEYVVVLRDGTKLKLSRGHRAALGRLLGR